MPKNHWWVKLPYKALLGSSEFRRLPRSAKGLFLDLYLLMADGEERGALVTQGNVWSDDEIALAAGGDRAEVLALLSALITARIVERRKDGSLYHPWLHQESRKASKCSEAGKRGGGNPTFGGVTKGKSKGDNKGGLIYDSNPSSPGEGMQGERVMATTIPPPLDSVIAYGVRICLPEAECRHFFDHHEARGWMSGKSKIVNWQRAMSTWLKNFRSGVFSPRNGTQKSVTPTQEWKKTPYCPG